MNSIEKKKLKWLFRCIENLRLSNRNKTKTFALPSITQILGYTYFEIIIKRVENVIGHL